ncbi:hypothetical protein GCM10010466_28720 [Planomonospora alba]|uniref:Lipoprotein n=1 Tax=Planomonospora alba TaxID=161354 RepID=A0ABP6N6R2_9ACTN
MRRWIALTAAALTAPALVTATSASAQAATASPADALKRQFKPGHGVQVSQTSSMSVGGEAVRLSVKSEGRLQFGPAGPVASDLTVRMVADAETKKELERTGEDGEPLLPRGALGPYRMISVKGSTYASGGIYSDRLPEGKKWVRSKEDGTLFVAQTPDVLEPAVLAALVKDSDGKHSRDGLRHRGTVTYAELYRISPSFRTAIGAEPTGRTGKTEISWRLWLDGKGLPRRVVSSETLPVGRTSLTSTSDSRFRGWGAKVAIAAPPAAQVIDEKDLPSDIPTPKEVVNAATTRPGGN